MWSQPMHWLRSPIYWDRLTNIVSSSPPVIQSQPASQTVFVGDNVTFFGFGQQLSLCELLSVVVQWSALSGATNTFVYPSPMCEPTTPAIIPWWYPISVGAVTNFSASTAYRADSPLCGSLRFLDRVYISGGYYLLYQWHSHSRRHYYN